MQWLALSIVLVMGWLMPQRLQATPLTQGAPGSESTRNVDAVIDSLRPILKSTRKAARIYYLGSCKKAGDFYFVAFPHIRVQPPLRNDTGLEAIRDIFQNEKNVKVSDGADGIIRIAIGKLPATILDAKISTITFSKAQQYTENLAIWRLEDSKEVDEAKLKLRTRPNEGSTRISGDNPQTEGAPHLPTSMVNVTLDQALDSVARTFDVVVFYGACTAPRRYTIYQAPIQS